MRRWNRSMCSDSEVQKCRSLEQIRWQTCRRKGADADSMSGQERKRDVISIHPANATSQPAGLQLQPKLASTAISITILDSPQNPLEIEKELRYIVIIIIHVPG